MTLSGGSVAMRQIQSIEVLRVLGASYTKCTGNRSNLKCSLARRDVAILFIAQSLRAVGAGTNNSSFGHCR